MAAGITAYAHYVAHRESMDAMGIAEAVVIWIAAHKRAQRARRFLCMGAPHPFGITDVPYLGAAARQWDADVAAKFSDVDATAMAALVNAYA